MIDQITKYIEEIRTGKRKDKNGRVLAESTYENVRFTCYVLCDIARDMADFLTGRGYRRTPDGKSYYFYLDSYNAYIEVIPYSKMVEDSAKRSQILFDTLFCQTP